MFAGGKGAWRARWRGKSALTALLHAAAQGRDARHAQNTPGVFTTGLHEWTCSHDEQALMNVLDPNDPAVEAARAAFRYAWIGPLFLAIKEALALYEARGDARDKGEKLRKRSTLQHLAGVLGLSVLSYEAYAELPRAVADVARVSEEQRERAAAFVHRYSDRIADVESSFIAKVRAAREGIPRTLPGDEYAASTLEYVRQYFDEAVDDLGELRTVMYEEFLSGVSGALRAPEGRAIDSTVDLAGRHEIALRQIADGARSAEDVLFDESLAALRALMQLCENARSSFHSLQGAVRAGNVEPAHRR